MLDIRELQLLTEWFFKEIGDRNIIGQINSLSNLLKKGLNSKVSYQKSLSLLMELVNEIDNSRMTPHQLAFLDDTGLGLLVSSNFNKYLTNMFDISVFDKTQTHVEFLDVRKSFNDAYQRFSGAKLALGGMIFDHNDMLFSKGLIPVNIHFKEEASINDFVEMKSSSDNWVIITRGLTGIYGEDPSKIKIVAVENGSIILKLAASSYLVKLITQIISNVVRATTDVINLKKAIVTLKGTIAQEKLKIEILKNYNVLIKNIEDNLPELVLTKLIDENQLNGNEKNHDKLNDLRFTIKLIGEFLNKGGDIAVDLSGDTGSFDEKTLLEYKEVKRLVVDMNEAKEQKLIELKDNQ